MGGGGVARYLGKLLGISGSVLRRFYVIFVARPWCKGVKARLICVKTRTTTWNLPGPSGTIQWILLGSRARLDRLVARPPCLVLFKMAHKISMSQWALGKVTTQRYISSQRYIPNNVTLKKRTVCILRPVPAFGSAPVMRLFALTSSQARNESKANVCPRGF